MIENIIIFIISKHSISGIDINPPATQVEIDSFEKQIGFYLPLEFIYFYHICNGFNCTEDVFNMTALLDILNENNHRGKNWFYFSEYMIYSDMWGLRITDKGNYEIFNGSYPSIAMTSSLNKFLTKFLEGNVFEKGGLYDWQRELKIG